MKATVLTIHLFEPYPMTYTVPFLRQVTPNKTYDVCMFSKFVNFVQIDLKIGPHIDWTYTMYHTEQCTNQNNVFLWQPNTQL